MFGYLAANVKDQQPLALPQERQAFVDLEGKKKGVQAFLDKRKPVWQNK